MKSPSATVTQCRSKRSPRKVSRKREYCRYRPETFGNFSRELFFLGVWRPLSECKKAPILRDFRDGDVSYLQLPRLAGWGGRIRTSVWWNQNPPGSSMISMDFLTKQ